MHVLSRLGSPTGSNSSVCILYNASEEKIESCDRVIGEHYIIPEEQDLLYRQTKEGEVLHS